MAPIRMSGMNSGLDTEAIVKAMVSGYENKKQKVEKSQTKLEWSQEIWKGLNTKVYSLYTGMDKFRFTGSYKAKKTSVSDQTKASVTAGANAVDGTQKLKVKQMATSGYLTGGKIQTELGSDVTTSTRLSALGIEDNSSFTIGVGKNSKTITMTGDMTVKDLVTEMQDAGVNASFDEKNGRFFVSAKGSGAANDFTISGDGQSGVNALISLGLNAKSDEETSALQAIKKFGTFNSSGELDVKATKADVIEQFNEYKKKYDDALAEKVSLVDQKTGLASSREELANQVSALNSGWAELNNQKNDLTSQMDELTSTKAELASTKEGLGTQKQSLSDQKDAADAVVASRTRVVDYLNDKKTVINKRSQVSDESALANDQEYQDALARVTQLETAVNDGTETDKNVAWYVKDINKDDYSESSAALSRINSNIAHNTNKFIEPNKTLSESLSTQISDIDTQLSDIDTQVAGIDSTVSDLEAQISDLETQMSEQDPDDQLSTLADQIAELDSQIAELEDKITAEDDKMTSVTTELSESPLFSGVTIDSSEDEVAEAAISKIQDAITQLDSPGVETATRVHGQDAEIYLNGAMFTSETNSFEINGLNINVTGVTGDDEISIITSSDNDAIYDKVKDFLSSYNDIINELQSLYNADSAKDYEPLTEDEKAEMSDTEIEKWETKIKDSLLRRDSTLGGVINTMTMAMSKSYEVTLKDGTKQSMGLVNVGIHTLGYLNATKNEQYAYHIDGDSDDANTSGYSDKLKALIESDPDAVSSLISQVSQGLYEALGTKIGSTSTELSSAYTMYNDKQMKSQLDTYKKNITQWEDRIADSEEMYYKKFTAMEKALANLNSSQSSLSGLMG